MSELACSMSAALASAWRWYIETFVRLMQRWYEHWSSAVAVAALWAAVILFA